MNPDLIAAIILIAAGVIVPVVTILNATRQEGHQ